MSRFNLVLVVLLVIQVIIGVVIYLPESSTEAAAVGEPLVADYSPTEVVALTVTDDEGESISVRNVDGQWALPEADNYPVLVDRVNFLLGAVSTLTTERLIAQTATSHSRLGVADDTFRRRLDLEMADGRTETVYIGTATGQNATHMRREGDDAVYLIAGLDLWQINTTLNNWVNTLHLSSTSANVRYLRVENENGIIELQREGDTWSLVDAQPGEVVSQNTVDALVRNAANVRITLPVGLEAEAEFGMDAPQAVITYTVDEAVVDDSVPVDEDTFDFMEGAPGANNDEQAVDDSVETVEQTYIIQVGAQLGEGDDYYVLTSNSDYYVRVSSTFGDRFATIARADVLEQLAVDEPVEGESESTPEAESTSEANGDE